MAYQETLVLYKLLFPPQRRAFLDLLKAIADAKFANANMTLENCREVVAAIIPPSHDFFSGVLETATLQMSGGQVMQFRQQIINDAPDIDEIEIDPMASGSMLNTPQASGNGGAPVQQQARAHAAPAASAAQLPIAAHTTDQASSGRNALPPAMEQPDFAEASDASSETSSETEPASPPAEHHGFRVAFQQPSPLEQPRGMAIMPSNPQPIDQFTSHNHHRNSQPRFQAQALSQHPQAPILQQVGFQAPQAQRPRLQPAGRRLFPAQPFEQNQQQHPHGHQWQQQQLGHQQSMLEQQPSLHQPSPQQPPVQQRSVHRPDLQQPSLQQNMPMQQQAPQQPAVQQPAAGTPHHNMDNPPFDGISGVMTPRQKRMLSDPQWCEYWRAQLAHRPDQSQYGQPFVPRMSSYEEAMAVKALHHDMNRQHEISPRGIEDFPATQEALRPWVQQIGQSFRDRTKPTLDQTRTPKPGYTKATVTEPDHFNYKDNSNANRVGKLNDSIVEYRSWELAYSTRDAQAGHHHLLSTGRHSKWDKQHLTTASRKDSIVRALGESKALVLDQIDNGKMHKLAANADAELDAKTKNKDANWGKGIQLEFGKKAMNAAEAERDAQGAYDSDGEDDEEPQRKKRKRN